MFSIRTEKKGFTCLNYTEYKVSATSLKWFFRLKIPDFKLQRVFHHLIPGGNLKTKILKNTMRIDIDLKINPKWSYEKLIACKNLKFN